MALRVARRLRQRLAGLSSSGSASTTAISARARSASSIVRSGSAPGRPREEDHAFGVGRDLAVVLDHLGLAPTAARVVRGHRGPHALVQLAAELLHQALLLL